MNKYTPLILLFLLNGCGQYSIRNIDKPPPQLHELWIKKGASFLDIRKSLLECGQISLGRTTVQAYENSGIIEKKEQVNHSFLVAKCMLNSGYIEQNTSWTLNNACSDRRYHDYPACQPNAIIPTPSVERRLNSWHCKIETDYEYCLKHAVNPSACKPDDYKHPPPECLASEQASMPQSGEATSTKNNRPYNFTHQSKSVEQTEQLQHDTQTQSNRDMKNLLRNTAPKSSR